MRKYSDSIFVQFGPGLYLWLCILLLSLPIKWFLAWILVACIHELSHFVAIKLCRVQTHSVKISLSGAKIRTCDMSPFQELLSAAAGPCSGILLLMICRRLPIIYTCAYLLTAFNLLPIKDFDGWRILKCVLQMFLSHKTAHSVCFVAEILCYICFLTVSIYLVAFGIYWVLIAILLLLFRRVRGNLPCKP